MFFEIHDYNDDRVNQLCDWVIDVSFALSTALAPMMIYLVLKESKGMGIYRWYVLNEVFWCYLYDVAITAWKPVFLGPLLAGYSQSPIYFSRLGSWLTFATATIFTVNSGLGLVMAVLYRLAQRHRKMQDVQASGDKTMADLGAREFTFRPAKHMETYNGLLKLEKIALDKQADYVAYPGALREFFEKKIIVIYIIVHLASYSYFLAPTPFAQMWNDDDVRAYLSKYPQEVAELASLNGLWIYRRTTLTELFCLSIAIWYSLFVVLVVVFLTKLYFHARVWKLKQHNSSTYRLQVMLLKALIIQTTIGTAFIAFPMVTIGLTLYTGSLKGGPIVTIMVAMTSVHASVDFAIIIYFITPYRRALLKLLRKLIPCWTKEDTSEKRNSSVAGSYPLTRVQQPFSPGLRR